MAYTEQELAQCLDKARIGVMKVKKSMFYTTIMLNMKFLWDKTVRTAYTNGLTLGCNPDFFMSSTPGQRTFVIVHECAHVARMHNQRRGHRDPKLYNMAGDYVINLEMKDAGYEMYPWVLCDERFRDMHTEQVYDILKAEQLANPTMHQDLQMEDLGIVGEPQLDDDGNPVAVATAGEIAAAVTRVVQQAAMQAQMSAGSSGAGSVPNDVQVFLTALLNPKLPWQVILRRYFQDKSKNGFNWNRPNRRTLPSGIYLPSRRSTNSLIGLQAWVDMSASETDEDFQRFVSELNGILKIYKPKKITLGQFDTCIKSIHECRNASELARVQFHGRGGTCMEEVFEHLEKTKPSVALVFTDGGFMFHRQKCSVDIIWMIHDNPNWTAPWGKVIHYNTKD